MSDFEWGEPACPPHVRPLRERVSAFVRDRIVPHEDTFDSGGRRARDLTERLGRQARTEGLWGLALPRDLGGAGLSLLEYAHVAEAEGASDHGPAVLGGSALLDLVTLAGHDAYREQVADGRLSLCNAMTEPGTSGSDPALTTTRATREPDGSWTLRGGKWFVSGVAGAGLAAVLARTAGAPPDKNGLSVLLVSPSSPGFRVVRELPVLGAGGQWEIALDGVRVPADHLAGEEGEGLRVVARRVRLSRLLRCLRWLGQAERAFTLMCGRARDRRTATGRLADHQLVQQLVFDALLAIRTTRPLVFEAVARLDAGLDARTETGLAKVAAARMLRQVTDAAIQVHGAEGLGPDTALPRLFRTGRTAGILDGPDELHITATARRVLRDGPGRFGGSAEVALPEAAANERKAGDAGSGVSTGAHRERAEPPEPARRRH
ncbi:acyl-CoA dehydrogenase [Sphaerisporangium rufum]|uniref:Acyl-CoA dehydrogenase n=1 Tax=Sphaerisporangium rufum TaxID=1381558 RepID=A0A919R631_9ACTN|nr:acyl-CoA dehydrogenase family protein [Sphaerisporangium rufum]GII79938.1 acyl-CoA dehydrogenase [Sphaerisporangium rufum]